MVKEKIDGMLSKILDYDNHLTDWEYDFINEMVESFEKGTTEKQEEKVLEIFERLNL